MKTLRTSLFIALGLGAVTSVASANGFFIFEHDAKPTGRAGAAAATDVDASAIVYNPGGIAVGNGTQIQIGGALIAAKGTYTDNSSSPQSTSTDNAPAVVPSFFATTRLTDLIAVGFGVHLPFGLAISWPTDSPQADVSLKSSLRTYFLTPAVGLNLNKFVPGLSLGAGLDLVPATVELEQAVTFGDTVGNAKLGGKAFGVGARAGVQFVPEALSALKLGVAWRSQINLDFKGDGDFDIAEPFRSQLPPDGEIATTIKLPQQFTGGVAYDVLPALQLEVNAVWTNWSKFKEINIDLPGDAPNQVRPQDYKNTVTLRVGAEYKLPKQHAAVRIGYIYDPTPIPATTISATLPDANRNDVTVGGSYSFGNYDVSLAALAVLPSTKSTANDPARPYEPFFQGEYKVSAFVASLTLSTRFGGGAARPSAGTGTITRR
ncbi:MAG: putative outer membrane protein [Deltaproteobacteria bacterium]|nr:putative outer membrane protein [Deltaproteobacteria bacterium]